MCTKNSFKSSIFILSGAINSIKYIINGLEIDEILTNVSMYGGIPLSFSATDAQTAMWLFCLLFLEIRISIFFFFAVHCVVVASSFSLNHNLALESKQNSVDDPTRCKVYLFIYWNYKHYTKCIVIWCGVPSHFLEIFGDTNFTVRTTDTYFHATC